MSQPRRTSSLSLASNLVITAAFALAALGAIGCVPFGDPEPSSADGTIALGGQVKTDGFVTLRLRVAPEAAFDPAAPSFPADGGEGSAWSVPSEELSTVTFPHAYRADGSGLPTPTERWQIFAWLSASGIEGKSSQPGSGEPYGRATFALQDCGDYGDYCGSTEGVNITIDQIAP